MINHTMLADAWRRAEFLVRASGAGLTSRDRMNLPEAVFESMRAEMAHHIMLDRYGRECRPGEELLILTEARQALDDQDLGDYCAMAAEYHEAMLAENLPSADKETK